MFNGNSRMVFCRVANILELEEKLTNAANIVIV
jgi:hypothetical protein